MRSFSLHRDIYILHYFQMCGEWFKVMSYLSYISPAAATQIVNIILLYFTISYDSQERLESVEFGILNCKLPSFVNKGVEFGWWLSSYHARNMHIIIVVAILFLYDVCLGSHSLIKKKKVFWCNTLSFCNISLFSSFHLWAHWKKKS